MSERPWHPHTSFQYKIGKYEFNENHRVLNPDKFVVVNKPKKIFVILYTCQTETGEWVGGEDYDVFSEGGGYSMPDIIYGKRYPTQEAALLAHLEMIANSFHGIFREACRDSIDKLKHKNQQLTLF